MSRGSIVAGDVAWPILHSFQRAVMAEWIRSVYTWRWHPPDGSATACTNLQLQCVSSDHSRSGCTRHYYTDSPLGHRGVLVFFVMQQWTTHKSASRSHLCHIVVLLKELSDRNQARSVKHAPRQVELQATGPRGLQSQTKDWVKRRKAQTVSGGINLSCPGACSQLLITHNVRQY